MALSVENLAFAYPGRAPTLDGLSFEIAPGEVFGFLGPSGAGKSTCQRILTRLLTGWSGSAHALGRSLAEWDHRFFDRVGVCFEAPSAWPKLTGRENLEAVARLFERPLRDPTEMLRAVGLADAAHRRVETYSKGMKIRLNLARALMHDPDLLFLDEPTAGLDPANARRARALIAERAAAGAAVFLTTHDMTLAETLCDRVGFLAGGRLHAVDAPADLRRAHADRSVSVTVGQDVRLFPLEGLAANAGFLSAISDPKLIAIESREPTLEEVFLRVVGASLSTPEEPPVSEDRP